ncbi:hypothetical protein [Streptomyces sp. NPDC054961]
MDGSRIPHHAKATARPNAVLAALLATVGAYGLMQTLVIPAMSVLGERLHADTATAGWLAGWSPRSCSAGPCSHRY